MRKVRTSLWSWKPNREIIAVRYEGYAKAREFDGTSGALKDAAEYRMIADALRHVQRRIPPERTG